MRILLTRPPLEAVPLSVDLVAARAAKSLSVASPALKSARISSAVASSSTRRAVDRNLKSAGITDKFNVTVCGEMAARSKPAPDIYLKACELLGESPEDCIALEDSRNGLWSAHNAGCRVIMVPDLWKADEETEKILWKKLGSLLEVRNFLRGDE